MIFRGLPLFLVAFFAFMAHGFPASPPDAESVSLQHLALQPPVKNFPQNQPPTMIPGPPNFAFAEPFKNHFPSPMQNLPKDTPDDWAPIIQTGGGGISGISSFGGFSDSFRPAPISGRTLDLDQFRVNETSGGVLDTMSEYMHAGIDKVQDFFGAVAHVIGKPFEVAGNFISGGSEKSDYSKEEGAGESKENGENENKGVRMDVVDHVNNVKYYRI
ncbi:hypothetical protein L596_028969 [Steinernema carpocapsae]|uniref:Uncharacterized protein n=1 Tax=Steinernema carpocapsae TaxID=34508 RepID=A0A4U5LT83_STECR|nr:hypothetical protein L596_028969 [Steinernema carpocapsae]